MKIEVVGLSFTYPTDVRALDGIDLIIEPGETVALIGQNGAGKTTLARHLNGLLKPGAGSVRVGGWDTRQSSVDQLAARVGYVFQNPDDQLFQRTVWDEAAFGPRNLGQPWQQVEQQVQLALEAVGLDGSMQKHPYDLIPAGRKLLALASILAMNTPVLVLDEPTTGQDFQGVERIGRIVDQLAHSGKTVIAISHDIDFCAEHFSRAVIMAKGRILLDGPARAVLSAQAILAEADVEPPQLVRLASGLQWDHFPLTIQEFTDQYLQRD